MEVEGVIERVFMEVKMVDYVTQTVAEMRMLIRTRATAIRNLNIFKRLLPLPLQGLATSMQWAAAVSEEGERKVLAILWRLYSSSKLL